MDDQLDKVVELIEELKQFAFDLASFLIKNLHLSFLKFEAGKGVFVTSLYKQRGRLSRRLIHSGMAALTAFGVVIAPVIAQEFPGRSVNPLEVNSNPEVLSASVEDTDMNTLIPSDRVRDKIIDYTVAPGDTLSVVAEKFGVSEDTIRSQNNIKGDSIKEGQTLQILPVTGVLHKVQKGDTIYSIAKKYDADPQAIADFPFNTFSNDETLELAIGQTLVVPDGVMPAAPTAPVTPRTRQTTPNAGAVAGSGNFVWPASGTLSQHFVWYHPGLDIANRAAPDVLAADGGSVVYAGCVGGGYGCHVIVDHKNGYKTLYAHLSKIYVNVGQGVGRGGALGKMGSTGRSTGIHLHFEVHKNGAKINPLGVLK